MKILVTGANGFIGKALTKELLRQGHIVFAFVTNLNEMKDIECENLKSFKLLFEDYYKISTLIMDNIDTCFHFAWAGLCGFSASDVELQLSDVKATYELLNQIIKLNCKKFIMASTMNTLEVRQLIADPLKHNPRKVSIHVASKINAEIIARVVCFDNHIQFNEAIIAMAYGPNNMSKMIPNVIISKLLKGEEPKLVPGNNLYDIVYIDDIVSAMIAINEKGVDKQSYYVGHDDNRTFKDIFSEVGIIVNPNIKLRFGEYPEDNSIDYSLIDRKLLTKDTGWVPTAVFENSIKETVKWIQDNILLF